MSFNLLNLTIFAAVSVLIDWLAFDRMTYSFPGITRRGARAYRDYFFPRILFVVLGAGLLLYGADPGGGSGWIAMAGAALFFGAHVIQYFWFVTD